MCFPQINTQFDLRLARSVLLYQHYKKKQINQNLSGASEEEHENSEAVGLFNPIYVKGITIKITKLAFCFQQETVKIFSYKSVKRSAKSDTG